MPSQNDRAAAPEIQRARPATGVVTPARVAKSVLLIVLAVLLYQAPSFLDLYWVRVLSNVCMFAALAQAINLIAGFTRMADQTYYSGGQ